MERRVRKFFESVIHFASAARRQPSPSPPAEGGEGRGEEALEFPLSPALSPLVPRGEGEELHAGRKSQNGSEKIGFGPHTPAIPAGDIKSPGFFTSPRASR